MTELILSSSTIKHVKQQQKIKNAHHLSLRIGIKRGGCRGLSYFIGFDAIKENDTVFSIENVTVVIDSLHLSKVVGLQIDFNETNGFSFQNKLATKTCECGNSFSITPDNQVEQSLSCFHLENPESIK